ncbi:MAG: guanylate kinase [Proteobacteria bacterium]|nr:guanylate kinase [Pseudomonadota bacterium]
MSSDKPVKIAEETRSTGNLFIVAAPSGAGKSSLVNALLERDTQIALSISTTTRPPRPGESEGEHYHFVSPQSFEASREAGEFLEYARVFDHWYATSRRTIAKTLEQGRDIILEIDWQGARQVKQAFPGAVSIFILPPSLQSLRQRLGKRGQDSAETIARRMRDARCEISHWVEFDYLIINDDFELALSDMASIISAARLSLPYQRIRQRKLLEELLKTD